MSAAFVLRYGIALASEVGQFKTHRYRGTFMKFLDRIGERFIDATFKAGARVFTLNAFFNDFNLS